MGKKFLMFVVSFVMSVVTAFSSFVLLWSVFCFLGGPDGRFGTPESFAFGFFYLLLGGLLLWLSVIGIRKLHSKCRVKNP